MDWNLHALSFVVYQALKLSSFTRMNRRTFVTLTSTATGGALVSESTSKSSTILRSVFPSDSIKPAKFKPSPSQWSDNDFTIAWIGHSTLLINFFGTRIITDPIFSDKAGINVLGLFTLGPQRLVYPALSLADIGDIDLILLSHAHMDHLDYPTLEEMKKNAVVVMAKNTSDVIENLEFEKVHELDWGEKKDACDVSIEALEVKHFGWRFPWEEDRSKGNRDGRSFNAYLVKKNGFSFVFGGDTAHTPLFKKLGARGEKIDLAAMPIGAYDPWIMNHCNPEQAAEMSIDMNASHILPIHWRTFTVSDEPTFDPIKRLRIATEGTNMKLILDTIGQTAVMG